MTTNSNNSSETEGTIKSITMDGVEHIEGTPFSVAQKDDQYMIVIGKTVANDMTFKTGEEAVDYVMSKPWDLITTLAVVIAQYETSKNQ